MQQQQLPKCFIARLNMLVQTCAGPDIWAQGCLLVLTRKKELAWFSAETEMWVNECLS